jgi:hypothetical protein
MRINTDLGLTEIQKDAKRIAFQPVTPLTANNVEDAINQVQANIAAATSSPPVITATTVTFVQSPYAVQSTDFILEVDTTGGIVVINPQAVGTRTQPLEVKDAAGNAATNNIQINATIEGQTPYLLRDDFDSVTIRANKGKTAYEVVTW